MRILLFTWGSMGDVVPFVAFSKKLQSAGFEVVLGAADIFSDFIKSHNIDYIKIGSSINKDKYNELMDKVLSEKNPRKQFKFLLKNALINDLEKQYEDCLDAIKQTDIVICHWMQIAGLMASEKLNKPVITITLNPIGVTNIFGAIEDRDHDLVLDGNKVWRLSVELSDLLWGDEIHAFRKFVNLKSVSSISINQYSQKLNLVAVSPCLVQEHECWPENHHAVGFWSLSDNTDWKPDDKIRDFLLRFKEPLLISFGSMAGNGVEAITVKLINAIKTVGYPVIVQAGWGELGNVELPENVIKVGYISHDWLLPKVKCVIHHGGAGTTAAALRFGVPSIVVWHMFDQPYWGNLIDKGGLGTKPLAIHDLTTENLVERINQVLGSDKYHNACADMAVCLSAENGLDIAMRKVNEFISEL